MTRLPSSMLLLAAVVACRHLPLGAQLAQRYDFAHPAGRVALPGVVVEASGLTFTEGGHLLVHGDEVGVVVALDPATGREVDRFRVGRPRVEDDLEGIASVGDRLFLVSSTGRLYEFREGGGGASMPTRITDSLVARQCEVEGLEYDPHKNELLLACKVAEGSDGFAVIHRLPVDPGRKRPRPRLVPLDALTALGMRPRLHPSALARDPETGTLVLTAAREGLLVALDEDEKIAWVVSLPSDRHPQPEGLAVGDDGTLYIADEGAGQGPAHLTWYAPVPSEPTEGRQASPRGGHR